ARPVCRGRGGAGGAARTPGRGGRRKPRPLGRPVDGHRRPLTHARLGRLATPPVPVAFLGVFFVWPLAAILRRSLVVDGRLDVPWSVLTSDTTREAAWFTVWQGALPPAPRPRAPRPA